MYCTECAPALFRFQFLRTNFVIWKSLLELAVHLSQIVQNQSLLNMLTFTLLFH